ncbi:PQQ-binding-like beta-propeller repeat protein [Micromonospora sp. WMMD1102]|uniref:outer membrane protein assembly factor BamB family protein n=1 Tax=Micromonospora sp. WMMD1102 TaxID=3016105 RepID=UPI00241582CF|nr:PQQ-binding-like beta-propeller repeat protein [Micromonospora sp. WMMD1102]MDG4788414.1 PQQ-binding-like beta-propeller repeat protein [Micromonospora sp. WMMD1102]
MVIDLGTERYEPPAAPARPPRELRVRRWRITGAILAGILAFSVGGAARSPEPALREVHAAPLGPADTYMLADGLLLTTSVIDPTDQAKHRIVCYDLTRRRQLWSADYALDENRLGPRRAGGLLLVFEKVAEGAPPRTTALDLRTGHRRWSLPYRSLLLPDAPTALVLDDVFRPEARIRPAQVDGGGEVYFGSDGHAYSEPPIELIVRGLDLDTGQLRWELPRLDSVRLVEASERQPPVLLTSSPDGAVEVRDLLSGGVNHRLDWPGGELGLVQRIGETVVTVAQSGSGQVVTAYSADLWQRRWSRTLTGTRDFVERCGPLLCQARDIGTSALDPATGETRWELPGPLRLLALDPWLVEMDQRTALRRVFETRTGRTVAELGGWRLTDDSTWPDEIPLRTDQPPLVLQSNPAGGQTSFGVIDPAGPSVRRLGVLPYPLEECVAAQPFMACRVPGAQLRVWRYHPPRPL